MFGPTNWNIIVALCDDIVSLGRSWHDAKWKLIVLKKYFYLNGP